MRQRIPEHRMTVEQRKLVTRLLEDAQAKIRQECDKASIRLRPFFLYIERSLFNPDLTIGDACRASRLGSDYSSKFKKATGMRPREYVEHHRIMLAQRIIRHTPMFLWEVSQRVGFDSYSVFSRRYEEVIGYRPKKEKQAKKKSELPQDFGMPEASRARSFDPRIPTNTVELETETPGLNLDRFWNDVSGLGHPAIKDYLIEHWATLTLDHHHYLLDKARYEGRMDRSRGEELCLAALDVLTVVELQQGKRYPDETALAYANLANMRRLRFDFAGAREAFGLADRYLRGKGNNQSLIFAQVDCLRISLLWWQQDFEHAIALHRRILPTIRESGSQNLLARSLILAAEIYDHWGHSDKAIPYLAEALCLTQHLDDPYLVFSVHFNLAHLYARSGRGVEAEQCMLQVRALHEAVKEQFEPFHMTYLEGQVCRALQQPRRAEFLFLEAREGYLAGNRHIYAALTALDLATLYLDMDDPEGAKKMATSAMQPIQRIGVHREAVAALAVLQEAQRHEVLSQVAITKALQHLDIVRKDPRFNVLAKV